jgi:methyl-accepting chemotaxis protein
MVIFSRKGVQMKLNNLKISVRLIMGFALVLMLMVALLSVGLYQMKQINDKLDRIVNVNNVKVVMSNNMMDSIRIVTKAMRTVALLEDNSAKTKELEIIDGARAKYNESAAQYEKLINLEEEKGLFANAIKAHEEIQSVDDSILRLAMANNHADAVKELMEKGVPAETKLIAAIQDLNNYSLERSKIRYDEALQNYEKGRLTMLMLGGAAIILGFVIALGIARSVTGPVNGLQKTAVVAASGDLTVDIAVKSKDEIGTLAESFKTMILQMRELVSQITEKAGAVAGSAQQLNSSSQQTTASANENAATMSEISSTVEQLTLNVQRISTDSETAANFARKGDVGIAKINDQMNKISGASGGAARVITGLNQKSQEISQIVELITGIADQTNLLALNAAIEAARAGEQGRGFAVVAEEVRKLAEQSAAAAKEIYTLINDMQLETQRAVDTMAGGEREVEAGTSVVKEVGGNFKEIINAVEGLTSQIEEVAAASEQMSAGVENVAASTEEQTAAMEEVSASAETLSMLAEELNQLVGKFKV